MLNKLSISGWGERAGIFAIRWFSPLLAIGLMLGAVPLWAQVEDTPSEPSAAAVGSAADSEGLKTDTLLDVNTTSDLHSDTTILADVTVTKKDDSGQVSVGPLSIWLGGIWQHDVYSIDDIFTYGRDGADDTDTHTRRLEGVIRSRLYDWGEVKAQYDFEARDWKDLYVRWHSRLTEEPYTITAGNQKEPMGLDWLSGTKAIVAQEFATPVDAFADWRSLGVRVHRAFELKSDQRWFDFWKGDDTAVTASFGVFTEDINRTNNTNLALTGRVTAGRSSGKTDAHLGASASLRQADGDYGNISFRPEINEADKIILARPRADRLGIIALEAAGSDGPFHLQAEAFIADYPGGTSGYGAGGYVQVGWFVTGEHRRYETNWGVYAPVTPQGNKLIAEVFSRFSHTRGDDDINGWNAYSAVTLGGNLYYRRFRLSVNALLGYARDSIQDQDDGVGLVARLQILL